MYKVNNQALKTMWRLVGKNSSQEGTLHYDSFLCQFSTRQQVCYHITATR